MKEQLIKTKNSISLFNTVLRLQLENSSEISAYEVYRIVCEGVVKGSKKYHEENPNLIPSKPSLEFTFGSTDLTRFFPKLLNDYSNEINMAIGTICTIEEAKQTLKWSENQALKTFSPYFDPEIFNFFKKTNLIYYPALTSMKDYEEFKKYNDSPTPHIKVFPSIIENADDLLNGIEGPFPELALNENKKRILKSRSKINPEDTVLEISTSLDYAKIRKKFLENAQSKIYINIPDISGAKLIKHIKKDMPNSTITATGISKINQEKIQELFESGASSIGSSITIKEPLSLLTQNKISPEEAKERIATNIFKIFTLCKEFNIK